MSRQGITVAQAYGEQLPQFDGAEDAERELLRTGDCLLGDLKRAALSSARVHLDECPIA